MFFFGIATYATCKTITYFVWLTTCTLSHCGNYSTRRNADAARSATTKVVGPDSGNAANRQHMSSSVMHNFSYAIYAMADSLSSRSFAAAYFFKATMFATNRS